VNAVINPVKLIITNYPEGQVEMMETGNNPEDETSGTRLIPFSNVLYMEREDFMEDAPKKFFRMTPGQEVRLKSAYIVKCTGCKKDSEGIIEEIYCEYDALTKSGMPESGRKVKGTLHWVSAQHALQAEVRLYDRLFSIENPSADPRDFRELLNPDSLKVLTNCYVEPSLQTAKALDQFQFQRLGYFNVDPDSTPEKLVFNRTVSLKDSWAKEQQR
jgi:glutaminyl-tRNA synthetase